MSEKANIRGSRAKLSDFEVLVGHIRATSGYVECS